VLHVILVGAEVELAPEAIAGHPAIRTTAKALNRKPNEVLLDQNVHAPAIRQLPDGERRGRPDILHYSLLALLESPLNKLGGLAVAIHTRSGELIRIKSDTRLPRGEARFQGLISKVLRDGASQDKAPLLWSDGVQTATQVLQYAGKGPVIRLDEGGKAQAPAELVQRAANGELTVVLGAFPAGDFSDEWKEATPETVSIFPQALNAWAVAAEVVAAFRAQYATP
jgi:rRNA small subunit pseudouridine methyltransferase Nep1